MVCCGHAWVCELESEICFGKLTGDLLNKFDLSEKTRQMLVAWLYSIKSSIPVHVTVTEELMFYDHTG
jgi:hypothetical protein